VAGIADEASNCPIGAGFGEPWNVCTLELMESDPIDYAD
jgi:hypothetical protein